MADQPAPPSNLRPMRPIKRVPFVEEMMPLVGPPLTDPNDQPFATAPAAAPPSAASAPSAATPSFVTTPSAATPSFIPSAASAPSLTSLTSTLASAAPAAAALASAPSAAGALGAITPILGSVAPSLGGAGSVFSEVASAAPAAEALISSPSAATAFGAASPLLNAVAPNAAQYANPLLQTVASHDMNAPFGDMADRVAGIGQPHPAEDAKYGPPAISYLETMAAKAAAARYAVVPLLEAAGVAVARVAGGVAVGMVAPSSPLNVGEVENVKRLHEDDAEDARQRRWEPRSASPSGTPAPDTPPGGD